jgi:hypothetical protein
VFLHNESIAFAKSFSQDDIVQFKYTNFIPGFAPPGTYGLTFNFIGRSGSPLACLAFSFKL